MLIHLGVDKIGIVTGRCSKNLAIRAVYITGLSAIVTADDISKYFGDLGGIEAIQIESDKCSCFVIFKDTNEPEMYS